MKKLLTADTFEVNDRRYKLTILACCVLYTLSVVCKGIYTSSLIEVLNSMKITKAQAGYALTAYYTTYSIGQIVFGRLSGRGSPVIKIGVSLICSAILLPFFASCNSLVVMTVIWGIHGIVQALTWPSVIEVQAKYLPDRFIENSAVIMASGLAFATIISYIISSICVYIYSWKLSFYFMAALAMIAGVITLTIFRRFLSHTGTQDKEKSKEKDQAADNRSMKLILGIMLVFETLLIIVVSYLRHSTTNWLPNMLAEVFKIPSYFSIIMTVAVAVFSLLGSILVKVLHRRISNYMTIVLITSGGVLLSFTFLRFLYDANMFVSVIFSSLIVMLAACMNVILVSVIPLKLRNVVNSGNFSAIMNAFASFSVALATTVSGAIIDSGGGNNWPAFYSSGMILIAFNVIVSVFASIFYKKKITNILK